MLTADLLHRFRTRNRAGLTADQSGIAAIEFSLLAPVFLLALFAFVELGILLLVESSVKQAVIDVEQKMIVSRQNDDVFNVSDYASEICGSIPLPNACEAGETAVSIHYAGRLPDHRANYASAPVLPVANYLDTSISSLDGDVWIVGVGTNWPTALPILGNFVNDSGGMQVAAFKIVVFPTYSPPKP